MSAFTFDNLPSMPESQSGLRGPSLVDSQESAPDHVGQFRSLPLDDPDEIQTYARRIRRGQPKFRDHLLRLYGSACAISGHGPECALQAAHIMPHSTTGHNHLDNGILLRADIHELLDEGLLYIEPVTLQVWVDPTLCNTPYWAYNGTRLRERSDGTAPSPKYLQTQWLKKSS